MLLLDINTLDNNVLDHTPENFGILLRKVCESSQKHFLGCFFPTKLKMLAYGEEKETGPLDSHLSPFQKIIFTSHSHLYLLFSPRSYLPERGEVLRFQFHTVKTQHFVHVSLRSGYFRIASGLTWESLEPWCPFTELVRRAHLKWFWVSGPVPIWWHLRCTNTANQRSSYEGDMLPGFELCPELSCVLLWPSPQDRSWTASCLITTFHGSGICVALHTLLTFPDCSQTDLGMKLPSAHSSPTWPRPAQLPDWSFYVGLNSGQVWGTADVAGIALWSSLSSPNDPSMSSLGHSLTHAQNRPQRLSALRSSRPEFKSCLSGHVTLGQCRPLGLCFSRISLITVLVFVFLKFWWDNMCQMLTKGLGLIAYQPLFLLYSLITRILCIVLHLFPVGKTLSPRLCEGEAVCMFFLLVYTLLYLGWFGV